jgi:hypothetical protein
MGTVPGRVDVGHWGEDDERGRINLVTAIEGWPRQNPERHTLPGPRILAPWHPAPKHSGPVAPRTETFWPRGTQHQNILAPWHPGPKHSGPVAPKASGLSDA